MIRATTNGVLKSYRSNLMTSFQSLNKSRDTVLSQRNFNSYAEDPAKAAQCFQLRRSLARVDSQRTVGNSVIRKYQVAYSNLESVVDQVDNNADGSALSAIIRAVNDPTGGGRNALGQEMKQIAEGIVQVMNSKYGDNYVFNGADGLNPPFTWGTDANGNKILQYRDIPVDVQEGDADYDRLQYISESEAKYEDIGLGLAETEADGSGELLTTSAFDSALQGINFLGYGADEEGLPNNIVSIIYQMGELLENCDDGQWQDGDEEKFEKLWSKLEDSAATLKDKHVALTTRADFLNTNQEQLETNAYTLNEQIVDIENVDLADAITSFSWAQYCYNAALKVGNSILSQSLMDYMN